MGFGSAGNNTGFNQDFSIYERLARVSGSTLEADPATASICYVSRTLTSPSSRAGQRLGTPDDTTWVFDVAYGLCLAHRPALDIDDVHYMFESIRDENVAGGGAPAFLMSANLDVGEPVDASTYRLTLTQPTGYIETLLDRRASSTVRPTTTAKKTRPSSVPAPTPSRTTTRTVAGINSRTPSSRRRTTTPCSAVAPRSSTRSSTPSSRTLPPWR